MEMRTRFRRLVAVFGAFLAASVSLLGLGLVATEQAASAAAGNLVLAPGVQPASLAQNTQASVVISGTTVTSAVGQTPGWVFTLPDNWQTGQTITISGRPPRARTAPPRRPTA